MSFKSWEAWPEVLVKAKKLDGLRCSEEGQKIPWELIKVGSSRIQQKRTKVYHEENLIALRARIDAGLPIRYMVLAKDGKGFIIVDGLHRDKELHGKTPYCMAYTVECDDDYKLHEFGRMLNDHGCMEPQQYRAQMAVFDFLQHGVDKDQACIVNQITRTVFAEALHAHEIRQDLLDNHRVDLNSTPPSIIRQLKTLSKQVPVFVRVAKILAAHPKASGPQITELRAELNAYKTEAEKLAFIERWEEETFHNRNEGKRPPQGLQSVFKSHFRGLYNFLKRHPRRNSLAAFGLSPSNSEKLKEEIVDVINILRRLCK